MKNTVQKAFKNWIIFMNQNGPMGPSETRLSTDEFREFRNLIKNEIEQLERDDENFNCGAMS